MPPALESVDDIDYVFRLRQDLLFFTFSRLHGLSVDVRLLSIPSHRLVLGPS